MLREMMLLRACVLSLACLPGAAHAETLAWAVLPIRATTPPTSDPTLLRLTEEVGRALHESVAAPVRVLSRELRDETCNSTRGECPYDIAALVRADRVVSMWLDDTHESLTLRVYRATKGLEHQLQLPCSRREGRVHCETKSLGRDLAAKTRTKLSPEEVNQAFEALTPRLLACHRERGDLGGKKPPKKAEVKFQLDERGRASNVRIEPRRIQNVGPYPCMARVIEELTLAGDARGLGPLRFPLPDRPASSP